MKEFEQFGRIGTMPHRSYYIPFAEGDEVKSFCGHSGEPLLLFCEPLHHRPALQDPPRF